MADKKYKITVEELTPYEETTQAWRFPDDPEKLYYSKYDVPEADREKLVSHKRPTGRMLTDSQKIFEQTIDVAEVELTDVIKAINTI